MMIDLIILLVKPYRAKKAQLGDKLTREQFSQLPLQQSQ